MATDLRAGLLVVVSVIATLIFAWLSIRAHSDLGWMFVVGFLAISLTLPLAADRSALVTAVALVPLLLAVGVGCQTLWAPNSIAESGSSLGLFVSGYREQWMVLALGIIVNLAALAVRRLGLENSS